MTSSSTGTEFFEEIKQYITDKGYIINKVPKFEGAVKPVKAPTYFTYYLRDGKTVLIKTFFQAVSGSTTDKIVAAYINLSEAPYDHIILVLDTRHLNVFTPYLNYFKKREWTMDKVSVMSEADFMTYIR